MASRIVYQTNDGILAIIIPVENVSINEIAKKDVPEGIPYKIIDDSIIPDVRIFRNAWQLEQFTPDGYGLGVNYKKEEDHNDEVSICTDPIINVNMQKAIEIKKDIIRKQRSTIFEKLDVEFMRALESGDVQKQMQIGQKKQLLRDVTNHPSIINVTTPEELVNADPISSIMQD